MEGQTQSIHLTKEKLCEVSWKVPSLSGTHCTLFYWSKSKGQSEKEVTDVGLFDHSISFEHNKYMNLGMIASTIIPIPVPYNHLDRNMKQIKLLK